MKEVTTNMHNYFYFYYYKVYATILLLVWAAAAAVEPCERKCGDVAVPYPFGIDDPNCAKVEAGEEFLLKCNRGTASESAAKLLLQGDMEVLNISLEEATVSVRISNSYQCYDLSGLNPSQTFSQSISLGRNSRFAFSTVENRLVGLGCDTLAFLNDGTGKSISGCVTTCEEDVELAKEGACSGFGCCQASIPKRLKTLVITLLSGTNHSGILGFNPCDFALLVDMRTFNVSNMRLSFEPGDPAVEKSSVLLDWVVGSETCEEAKAKGATSYACGPNTDCSYSDNALGYRCRCSKGFRGNPYVLTGEEACQDIDECKEPEKYKCEGKCKNIIGDYECKCPLGMHGDGKLGCQGFRVTAIAAVVGVSTFLVIIGVLIVYDCKRRRRERIFRENGGLVLKNQRVRIFSQKELAKATNNYDENQLLGRGGFASVYKGVLTDDDHTMEIAVKKPKESDNKIQIDKQQFHEEIAIVSQVNHKNVVRLLGLCLETKIPLLVYECVSNGTLYDHIHSKKSAIFRSWKTRLRIAAETALALDYLHSLAQPPIIHRDVKSTNILLDANYTAKVSDFGASVLIPPGQSGIATTVQGTLGYLDPEYLNTGTLTTMSDVYSFGVVLVELITGEKPISFMRIGVKRNIVQYFISKVKENRETYVADMVLDSEIIIRDQNEMEEIESVSELATRCLELSGINRPPMREVADELARLNKLNRNYWTQQNEETQELLHDSCTTTRLNNARNHSESELVEFTSSLYETRHRRAMQ